MPASSAKSCSPGSSSGADPVGGFMTSKPVRVLCVHGIGDHHSDLSWQAAWHDAITRGLRRWRSDARAACDYLMYDHLFDAAPLGPIEVARALWKRGGGGASHWLGDLLGRAPGVRGVAGPIRWTAGMIVQWADSSKLRAATRKALAARVTEFEPDVVVAHSLGSLVAYDTFRRSPALMEGRKIGRAS